MNTLEVEKQKTERMMRTFRGVKADSSGALPTEIEVIQVGMWDTPGHGMFMLQPEDLQEMKANFDAGVAQAGDGIGLPIDFSHDESGEAGGWIKSMTMRGSSLYATVEWTGAGKVALLAGNYKCFSPTFYPACLGGWPDPEDYDTFVPNVITGGALTNIPLFRGLQPIMASVTGGGKDKKNTIFISASAEGKHMPTLDEVRTKEASTLTEEEKQLIATNKDNLSADEKVKFGLEAAPAAAAANTEEEEKVTDPEAAKIAASVKSGESVVVKASVFNKMQDDVKEMKLEKITASVKTHVARGAIKADQVGKWAEKIMADASSEELLKDIPSNKVMASEIGDDDKAVEASKAVELLHNKVAASAKDDKFKGMSYSARRASILSDPENAQLAASIKEVEEQ